MWVERNEDIRPLVHCMRSGEEGSWASTHTYFLCLTIMFEMSPRGFFTFSDFQNYFYSFF